MVAMVKALEVKPSMLGKVYFEIVFDVGKYCTANGSVHLGHVPSIVGYS